MKPGPHVCQQVWFRLFLPIGVCAGVLPAGTCDDNTLAVAVNAAAGWGLVSAAAAGNSGNKAKIIAPACASKAVAVGAVYSTDTSASAICEGQGIQKDKVTCFSNRWAFATAKGEKLSGLVYATAVECRCEPDAQPPPPENGMHPQSHRGRSCLLGVLDCLHANASALPHGPPISSCSGTDVSAPQARHFLRLGAEDFKSWHCNHQQR
jgi:hypothetical protein